MSTWQPQDWRKCPILQNPTYDDLELLQEVESSISAAPPLVFTNEVNTLKNTLADVCLGKGFLLQGGDCAESFTDFNAERIRDTFKVILQMSVILTYVSKVPVVKMARMAGQFAKPRSSDNETQSGVTLPSYRGDMINGIDFAKDVRQHDPKRMLTAYHQSAAVLNLLRAYSKGGFADLQQVNDWNRSFVETNPLRDKYKQIADGIHDALSFMETCGVSKDAYAQFGQTDIFTAHEALLLNYEEALTRHDPHSGLWYDCSAHFLWIGERTRQLDHAHIAFLKGVANPIGLKVGPTMKEEQLLELVDTLNPNNEPGRLTLIVRHGAEKIAQSLPPLVRCIQKAKKHVVWVSDPMHGNTEKASNGYKTRHLKNIEKEIEQFFNIVLGEGAYPGGLHLEMTGQHVTECVGGNFGLSDEDLKQRYHTHCDPRLNGDQVLEVAFHYADLLTRLRN